MLRRHLLVAALLSFVVSISTPARADTLVGKVIGISDGDTFSLLMDKNPVKVRLANIDAPEKAQAFGNRAKQALSEMTFGKEVTCERSGLDRYGRSLATCTVGHRDVNAEMLRKGMAWVYRKYALNVPQYYQLEEEARVQQIGLWADRNPVPPWEWRKQQKER